MLWKFVWQLYSVMWVCDQVGSHEDGVPGEPTHGPVFLEKAKAKIPGGKIQRGRS